MIMLEPLEVFFLIAISFIIGGIGGVAYVYKPQSSQDCSATIRQMSREIYLLNDQVEYMRKHRK